MPGMVPKVSWPQALAWRMERHLLEPIGTRSVVDVVRRLCGVQAQVASSAELAIRVRRQSSRPGEVAAALAGGRIVKTWAMRGALHLLTPEEGGAFLSLFADARPWERPVWSRVFGVTPQGIERLRVAVREELGGNVLTREELVAAVVKRRGFAKLGEALGSGWGTLLKPLAWQGDLVFGPSRGSRVTFMLPEAASSRWAGLPETEDAARLVIRAYLAAYAPTTAEAFGAWLSGGWFGKRKLRSWFDALGDELAEVDVDGERAFVLAADLDGLRSAEPTTAVRMLGGFDQWVLGPGTGDGHVTPTRRRPEVSKQSGWISPVIVAGGVVSGTWERDGREVRIGWFKEAGRLPRHALKAEVGRLSTILDRDLRATIRRA